MKRRGKMSELTPPVNEHDHMQGHLDAEYVLVEYGDFECPHCAAAYPVVKALQAGLGERLCFVYRHFPLIQIHPHAEQAAEAAEAAGAQNHFWKMHDTLFENSPELDYPHLMAYAQMTGLDVARFAQDLINRRYLLRVREDMNSGVRSGVKGTPTFFINGVCHRGGYDLESLMEALQVAQ
jgi:protein-disulfide isomerase